MFAVFALTAALGVMAPGKALADSSTDSASAQAMFDQVAQTTACNRVHSVQQRMCRWLLMTHDRVGSSEFHLTQEFLAQMLGVRRPSVTVAAGHLQRSGLIRYQRGRIQIADRAGLEAGACECYDSLRREFDRLLSVAL